MHVIGVIKVENIRAKFGKIKKFKKMKNTFKFLTIDFLYNGCPTKQ